MSEWQEFQLDEVYSFASGLSKSRSEFGFGYPFLTFKEVFHNYFLPKELPSLANTSTKERERCSIRRGDVFLTRTSETQEELGMSSVALTDYPEATFNGFTKRLRPKKNITILPEFAAYYFRSPRFRATVTSMASFTTRASLNNSMLSALKIVVPPVQIQKSIATLLFGLDSKIDLLHRQNKTLEGMAQALFRHWFINNEESSEWDEQPLSKVVDIAIGRTPPRKEFHWFSENPVHTKWVSIKDMGQSGIFMFDTSEYLTSEAIERFRIPIIPSDTVMLSFKMTLGRLSITTEPMTSNEAIAHFKIKSSTPFSKEYLYFFLKLFKYQTLGSTSSIVTSINTRMIKAMEIPIPDVILLDKFNMIVRPMFEKIKANQEQIRTLEKLRDTLLPKLMSGEVRVSL